jgi:hypothetical protein
MAKLTTEEARALAKQYYDLAHALSEFRFANWDSMSDAQRAELESLTWSLLTQSSDMTTRAIDLAGDDLKPAMKDISRATRNLVRAARRLSDVKSALNIAAKALALGSAIFTGNGIAIGRAVTAVLDTID